jgi:hypothetical protein
MDEPTDHGLKIAATPADDAGPEAGTVPHANAHGMGGQSSAGKASSAATNAFPATPAEAGKPASAAGNRRRRRRGGTVKRTPEEMQIEIERINRLNGNIRPGIARGTHPDDVDD